MYELSDLKKTPPPSFREIVSQQSLAQPVPSRTNNVVPERNHSVAQDRSNRSVHNVNNASNRGVPPLNTTAQAEPATAGANEQWKVQNRRRPRPKAIQGSYKSQAAGHTWLAAPRDIFVYHTDIETTTEDIEALIAETSKVNVLQIEKKNHAEAYYGSFRVSVRRNEFEEATKPEYWPGGWSIREYFRPRAKRDTEQSADGQEPPKS